jgi:hypothetical protein
LGRYIALLDDQSILTDVLRNIKYILPIIAIPGNEEHLYGFIFKIDNIDLKNTSWRDSVNFIKLLRDTESLFLNKDFNDKTLQLAFKLIPIDNYQIASEAVKLLVISLKYSRKQEKENIFRNITKDIYTNSSFYIRKQSVNFFTECVEQFSLNYLVENRLYELTLKLLTDETCIVISLFKVFTNIYPLLELREKKQLSIRLDNLRDKVKDRDVIYVNISLYLGIS